MSMLRELQAANLGNDYLEASRVAVAIRARAERYPGWRPWLVVALAFQRVAAGAKPEAEAMLREQLAALEPFTHGAWEQTALMLAQLLVMRRAYAEAQAVLEPIRDRAIELGVELDINRQMRACLALAKAGTGEVAEAESELDSLVELTGSTMPGTVPFALMCQARAELAAMQHDDAAVERMLSRIRPIFCDGKHPGLSAKYEQLTARMQPRTGDEIVSQHEHDADRLNAILKTGLATRSEGEQGDYLLSVLLAELGAERGCVYQFDNQRRPLLVASRNIAMADQLTSQVAKLASEHGQIDDESLATEMEDDLETHWTLLDQHGRSYAHRWLSNQDSPSEPSCIVLVDCDIVRLSTLPSAFVQNLARAVRALG
jgi:hypothetical protein